MDGGEVGREPAPDDGPTLYDILGVRQDASFIQIKQAYRSKAKTAHPDAGGDAETFAALKHACDVLVDQESRQRYDATGEHGGSSKIGGDPDGELYAAAAQIIGQALMNGADPEHDNLIQEAISVVHQRKEKAEADAAKIKVAVDKMEVAATRIQALREPNKLKAAVESDLVRLRAAAEQMAESVKFGHRLIGFLSLHGYRVDLVRPSAAVVDYMRLNAMGQQQFGSFRLGGR